MNLSEQEVFDIRDHIEYFLGTYCKDSIEHSNTNLERWKEAFNHAA